MKSKNDKIIDEVYDHFMQSETEDIEWDDVDEAMCMLEWLEDSQLAIEAEVKHIEQNSGDPRCPADHPKKDCIIPSVMRSVQLILDDYKKTKKLNEKNKFILRYYLALSHVGAIIY